MYSKELGMKQEGVIEILNNLDILGLFPSPFNLYFLK
jgi:hypothetical protein